METILERQALAMQHTSKSRPMVAIEMITYNHEKYIAQAIESVVKQKTDFDFKLIICEDCSTDNTAKICTEYKNKFPDKIDLHLAEKNMGVYKNARRLHELSFGSGAKYIAMLDGDDYWTDENKLQKQIDFLEQHPDYAICFHKATIVYEGEPVRNFPELNNDTKATTTLTDLMKGNYIHTPTCVFRKNFDALPDWLLDIFTGDWVIHMLNAEHGKIFFINQEMAAYRVHGRGLISPGISKEMDLNRIIMFKTLADYFEKRDNAEASRWFREIYYHQKGYHIGIANILNKTHFERFNLLMRCGFKTAKVKLFAAAFMALFLTGKKLERLWSAASEKKLKAVAY